jgi:hypothetical protein
MRATADGVIQLQAITTSRAAVGETNGTGGAEPCLTSMYGLGYHETAFLSLGRYAGERIPAQLNGLIGVASLSGRSYVWSSS